MHVPRAREYRNAAGEALADPDERERVAAAEQAAFERGELERDEAFAAVTRIAMRGTVAVLAPATSDCLAKRAPASNRRIHRSRSSAQPRSFHPPTVSSASRRIIAVAWASGLSMNRSRSISSCVSSELCHVTQRRIPTLVWAAGNSRMRVPTTVTP